MNYKLIACDMDETLLNQESQVGEEDCETLKALQNQGVYFVCATGRGYNSLYHTQKQLGQYNKANCYSISYNGGAITENKDNRLLHYAGLTFSQAKSLFDFGLAYDICIHVYTKTEVYMYRVTPFEIAAVGRRMNFKTLEQPDISFLKGEPIVKVLYMNPSVPYLQSIEQQMGSLTDGLDVSYSSNRYLEFNQQGVNKGQGLRDLAQLLNIELAETVAVGDNINDLSMLKVAGLSIGVANCRKDIVSDCDYITKATCNQNPLTEIAKKYFNYQK